MHKIERVRVHVGMGGVMAVDLYMMVVLRVRLTASMYEVVHQMILATGGKVLPY